MALLSHWHQGNMVGPPGPTCCRDANGQYGRRKLAVWETQTGSMGDANWQYGRRKLAVWGFQQGNLVHLTSTAWPGPASSQQQGKLLVVPKNGSPEPLAPGQHGRSTRANLL